MAHVTNRENAGNVGFEQERISIQCPSLWALPVTYKVRAGQQEPAFIPFDDIRQPVRARQCSDEDEHGACRHPLNLIGVGAKNRNLFQVRFAMGLGDAGVCPELNVGCLLNLFDQVL